MHDVLTIGIPVLAIFFGILLNRQGLNDVKSDLKEEIRAVETRVNARLSAMEHRMDVMQSDLSRFYTLLGEHTVRLDNLEKR